MAQAAEQGFSLMNMPNISSNYSKQPKLLPPTSVGRVLLHDNVSADRLLVAKLKMMSKGFKRVEDDLELKRKQFLSAQSWKQQDMREAGIDVDFLPEKLAASYRRYYIPAHRLIKMSTTKDTAAKTSGEGKNGQTPLERRKVCESMPTFRGHSATGEYRNEGKTFTTYNAGRQLKTGLTRREQTLASDPRFVSLHENLQPSYGLRPDYIQLSPSVGPVLLPKWTRMQTMFPAIDMRDGSRSTKRGEQTRSSRSHSQSSRLKAPGSRKYIKSVTILDPSRSESQRLTVTQESSKSRSSISSSNIILEN